MESSKPQTLMPIYSTSTDRRQLVQITEQIIDGQKVIKQIPLQAYQTILRPEGQGTA